LVENGIRGNIQNDMAAIVLRQKIQSALGTPLRLARQHKDHVGRTRRVYDQEASGIRRKTDCQPSKG
jgi:hypothetical protein